MIDIKIQILHIEAIQLLYRSLLPCTEENIFLNILQLHFFLNILQFLLSVQRKEKRNICERACECVCVSFYAYHKY